MATAEMHAGVQSEMAIESLSAGVQDAMSIIEVAAATSMMETRDCAVHDPGTVKLIHSGTLKLIHPFVQWLPAA